jgi:hypothetical protein
MFSWLESFASNFISRKEVEMPPEADLMKEWYRDMKEWYRVMQEDMYQSVYGQIFDSDKQIPKTKKKKKKPKLQTGEQIMTRLLGSLEKGNRAKEVIKSVGVNKNEKNKEDNGDYMYIQGRYYEAEMQRRGLL